MPLVLLLIYSSPSICAVPFKSRQKDFEPRGHSAALRPGAALEARVLPGAFSARVRLLFREELHNLLPGTVLPAALARQERRVHESEVCGATEAFSSKPASWTDRKCPRPAPLPVPGLASPPRLSTKAQQLARPARNNSGQEESGAKVRGTKARKQRVTGHSLSQQCTLRPFSALRT